MKMVLIVVLLICMVIPVHALDFTAPEVTGEAENLMPDEIPSFGEGLLFILKSAIGCVQPDLVANCRLCISVVAVTMLASVLNALSEKTGMLISMVGVLAAGVLLLGTTNTLIHIASDTVTKISDYGKLLLPVMTAALAAQGGVTGSATLYTGTAFFDSLLCMVVSKFLVPMIYLFISLVIGYCAIGERVLKQLRDSIKGMITWFMKTILYIFTGYMSISSVIAGSTDKVALKATKLTISGVVPVVGGIMSDASEAILISASVVKNAVGIYGLLAVVSILILPFLRVGILYLLLKVTGTICGIFASDKICELIDGFSNAMGFLLGMTGTVSLLFLVSVVCFMKGVS